MNRTIKFRGKSLQTGEWFYGYLQQYQEKHAKILCICATSIRTWKDALLYEIYPETVGQFTGLLDKNGKEIYEGDILCYIDDSGHIHTWEVVCEIACMKLRREKGAIGRIPNTPMFNHDTRKMHIIGNVYDHPELLKTEI